MLETGEGVRHSSRCSPFNGEISLADLVGRVKPKDEYPSLTSWKSWEGPPCQWPEGCQNRVSRLRQDPDGFCAFHRRLVVLGRKPQHKD